ncbi:Inactive rhomboid protein 1 [Portunus trituberculatus]|uniref:Inactive rhomboid protein 1 n=1 Tax=Portunus trituberculatus TaxID=210409 RepID=A0A5B7EDM7_PORTR|nr:Inactive rhomboid protein 1 [Portunus trituberculatus]
MEEEEVSSEVEEESVGRMVPTGRTDGQRTVNAPATTLGPSLPSAAVTRQHGQPQAHPPPNQHQHQHQFSPPAHPQSMSSASAPNTMTTSTTTTTATSAAPKQPPTLSRSLSRKEQTVAKRRAKSQISGTAGGRSKSRSYAPSSMSVPDEVFDEPDISPTTTATTTTTTTAATMRPTPPVDHYNMESLSNEVFFDSKVSGSPEVGAGTSSYDSSKEVSGARYHPSVQSERQQKQFQVSDSVDASGRSSAHIGRSRIWNRILDSCFDNSDRRQYGRGLLGRAFGRRFRESVRQEKDNRLSVWKKWSELAKGPDGRLSGSVCGQDPNYCKEPASIPPHEWPDDITRWPICRKRIAAEKKIHAAEHMACEVIGHPCCIGIHGECRITTREYCNFVRGYFHEEATLCSQVSCLNNVCGMIPFHNPDVPDQFYRLWTSLFIHAGFIHLKITIVLQYLLMRDMEKLAGPVRIGIIYIVSGIAGNLASAIFVPYRAEVGPSGSQFGLLACVYVEFINSWQMIKNPWKVLAKLVAWTLTFFLVGLLPWVDNYAHIFGFIFGFLLSYALLPFVSFGPYDRRRKVLLIWVCLVAVVVMLTALIILFYVTPIYECKICEYLNCIPLTRDFCAEQNIDFNKKLDI